MMIFFLILFNSNHLLANEKFEQKIQDLESRLEQLNDDTLSTGPVLSGQFLNHYEMFHESIDSESEGKDEYYLAPILMRVNINLRYDINNASTFYATMSSGKFWNNDTYDKGNDSENGGAYSSAAPYVSMKGSAADRGSHTMMDVAYFKYQKPTSNLAITAGRMTTNNGPPIHLLDNLSRQGTYPRMGYNAIFDGLGLIYKTPLKDENHQLTFRLFYTPFIFAHYSTKTKNVSDEAGGSNEKAASNAPQAALLVEYEKKNTALANNIKIYGMLWNYEKFYEEGLQDDTAAGAEFDAANLSLLFLSLENIANSNFSLSYSLYHFDERFADYNIHSSLNYLINANYVFDNKYTIGMEYIKTSKNYYLEDHTYEYITDFYTRPDSTGQHKYISYRLAPNQIIRLGHFNYSARASDWNDIDYSSKTDSWYTQYRVFF